MRGLHVTLDGDVIPTETDEQVRTLCDFLSNYLRIRATRIPAKQSPPPLTLSSPEPSQNGHERSYDAFHVISTAIKARNRTGTGMEVLEKIGELGLFYPVQKPKEA